MYEKILKFIEYHSLIAPGERVLAAAVQGAEFGETGVGLIPDAAGGLAGVVVGDFVELQAALSEVPEATARGPSCVRPEVSPEDVAILGQCALDEVAVASIEVGKA